MALRAGGYYGQIQVPDTDDHAIRRFADSVRQFVEGLESRGRPIEVVLPFETDSDQESGNTMLPEFPVYVPRVDVELQSATFVRDISAAAEHTLTLAKRDGRAGSTATTIGAIDYLSAGATAWTAFVAKEFSLSVKGVPLKTGEVVTLTIVKSGGAAAKIVRGILTLRMREAA